MGENGLSQHGIVDSGEILFVLVFFQGCHATLIDTFCPFRVFQIVDCDADHLNVGLKL